MLRSLRVPFLGLVIFLFLPERVHATALTSILAGFYFAVQSGGSFEIDYVVMDPDDKILLEGTNERQGDYIFTANKVRFSLALASAPTFASSYSYVVNEASISDKLLDFDIMVESEPRRTLSGQQQPLKEHTSSLEESTYKINGLLSSIGRTQK
ncbi:MAG: hypothetical protein TREMPRED_003230 [Tremellales sp. Tagirdzhanova-0007]|nr:MAG: hypothetical protein TREMPRED_003230 [Tremellales sp. Tagirdzhanova-0007]